MGILESHRVNRDLSNRAGDKDKDEDVEQKDEERRFNK